MASELTQAAFNLQLEVVPFWFGAMFAICLPQPPRQVCEASRLGWSEA